MRSPTRVPLTWLQAFEAAGRLGSFRAAAEELNVSPSNISHQIRDLESHLGTPLFSRSGRRVTLTQEGANYLPALSAGFERIRQASPNTTDEPERLHIGAFPFLANEIITPSLPQLKQRLPRTDIRLFTHNELSSLTHIDPAHRLDVVIRYGPASARLPGFVVTKLADVAVVPIVGPGLDAIDSIEAMLKAPLIRVIGPFKGWERWTEQYCPEAGPLNYALETDSFHAAALAVERGEGVCLGVLPYLTPWIRSGRVRALPDYTLPIEEQAALAVTAPFQHGNPVLNAFAEWLTDALA